MKVLHVLADIKKESGVSSFLMNLYRHIDHDKIEFEFLVCRKIENDYEDEINKMGGYVFYCGFPLRITTIIKATRSISDFFKKNANRYDAVHLHTPTLSLFVLRAAKKNGIKNLIVHSHSSLSSVHVVKRIINRCLNTFAKKYANNYWSCSDKAAQYLYGERFCENNNIVYIHNFVEPQKYQFDYSKREKTRIEMGIDTCKVLVHVSNFSPIKNVLFLKEVISGIVNNKNNFHFLFVGDGKTRSLLEDAIKSENLDDHVTFVGLTNDVSRYLSASDGLLLPSLKEGLPVTVIEAQANGLPCFVSDTITRECDLGQVSFLPLNESIWVDTLENFKFYDNHERRQKSDSFNKSRFAADIECKRVENLYMNMLPH